MRFTRLDNYFMKHREVARSIALASFFLLIILQLVLVFAIELSSAPVVVVNFTTNIFAEIFIFILFATCYSSLVNDKVQYLFELLVVCAFVSTALGNCAAIFYGHPEYEKAISILVLVAYTAEALYWLSFVCYQYEIFKYKGFDRIYVTIIEFGLVVYVALNVVDAFTHISTYVDEEGFVVYTAYSAFGTLIVFLFISFLLYISLKCDSTIQEKLVFNSYLLLPFMYVVLYTLATFAGYDIYFEAVFNMCSVVAIFMIFFNVNADRDRRYLLNEKQLTDVKMSTMMSQIQPHFISNTLGMIRSLYRTDSQKAESAMNTFISFLQKNFSDLSSTAPIPAEREIEHVKEYIDLQLMRWPDMQVEYDIRTTAFDIPTTTLQPIVENSIRHGLMPLVSGGKIKISTKEFADCFVLTVEDNGVGFDPEHIEPKNDNRKHIGVENIKERLRILCDGTLEIDSAPGEGTISTVKIPKKKGEF